MDDIPDLEINAVDLAYRPCDDGVRRWRDLDIAEWLGMKAPRNIRQVIEENRRVLERHATLHAASAKSTGGRPGIEYWLTFEQAMLICTLSRTERAEDVRTVMIRVFAMHVRGETAPARIVNALVYEIQLLKLQIEELRVKVAEGWRKRISRQTRRMHLAVIVARGGLCPCCERECIVKNGRLIFAEADHFVGRASNGLFQTWVVCRVCNYRLENSAFKARHTEAFERYQESVHRLVGAQQCLFSIA